MRARLRLAISRIVGGEGVFPGELWTSDVSAGGMYFRVSHAATESLGVGAQVSFELAVPPGAGYSGAGGAIRGAGCVVRAEQAEGAVGVAVRFSGPISLQFSNLAT